MRLTLRSMLNYMDDLLEPADREDIGQKIKDSEFATKLMQTISDVTRMMRLGAPKVLGRGMGFDPNTVAEYLDNELPGERVPDFEKVCLESHMQLAEVASCHQILSLVLGTAAEIDPKLRERMYAIGARADEAAADHEAAPAGAAVARDRQHEPAAAAFRSAAEPREKPEVPEYLREGRRRSALWPVLTTIALAAALIVAIISAAGPWDKTNPVLGPVLGLFGGDRQQAQLAPREQPKGPEKPAPEGSNAKTGTPEKGAQQGDGHEDADKGATPADSTNKSATSGPDKTGAADSGAGSNKNASDRVTSSVPPALPPSEKPADAATNPTGPAAVVPPPEAPKPGVAQNDVPKQPAPPLPPQESGANGNVTAPPSNPAVGNVATATPPTPTGPNTVGPNAVGSVVPPTPTTGPATPDAGPQRVGRLSNDQDLLLKFDPVQRDWHKVPAGSTFAVGDRLLVLPTFRPIITLSSGVTLQLAPETQLQFMPAVDGVPSVRLYYGRMVMLTAGNGGVKLAIDTGAASGVLVFQDAEAMTAIEVRPERVPGANPETTPAQVNAVLFGVKGASQWNPTGGQPADLKSPGGLVLAGDPAAYAGKEMPRWVNGEAPSALDQGAGLALAQLLDDHRPLTQALREMADPQTRRRENRSLGARSLALVDEFEPLVLMLNDVDQRAVWPVQISNLQAALARGPDVAAKVRAAMEKRHGKDGENLYRMLWGYTRQQLADGEAAKLVDDLDREDADDLIFRVLAIHDLAEITGTTYGYMPEQKPPTHQASIRHWREALKAGQIAPKQIGPSTGKASDAGKTPDAGKAPENGGAASRPTDAGSISPAAKLGEPPAGALPPGEVPRIPASAIPPAPKPDAP